MSPNNPSAFGNDLATLEGFLESLRVTLSIAGYRNEFLVQVGDLWCPRCGGERRMNLVALRVRELGDRCPVTAIEFCPSLFEMKCLQCSLQFHAAIMGGGAGPQLVIMPSAFGGLRTTHTPDAVAFFLDQASRSESTGATAAALTMYRSAVEALLAEQGYKVRMLGPKIIALEAAIAGGTAPVWTRDFHADFLKILKDLGNATTHIGDIDPAKYAEVLTPKLLSEVKVTMSELLEIVYERAHKTKSRLTKLQEAHVELKSGQKPGP